MTRNDPLVVIDLSIVRPHFFEQQQFHIQDDEQIRSESNLRSTQAKPGIDRSADPLFLNEAHWQTFS